MRLLWSAPVAAAQHAKGEAKDESEWAYLWPQASRSTLMGLSEVTFLRVETASFWVSGLCSPFRTFSQRAAEYTDAQNSGDMYRVQTVVNASLRRALGAYGR